MTLMYAQKAFRDATEAGDLQRMAAIFDAMTDLARLLVGTGAGMTAAQEAAWDKLDAIVNPNPPATPQG